ncbi:MAG: transketolase C-terminal domain-containing protein, partial [Planctomycetota bacterium]
LQPVELGKAEVFSWGTDGIILCCGTPLADCLKAAEQLREEGLDVGVVSARFIKPLDRAVLKRAIEEGLFVLTVEEAMLMGGFGSAVLEAANELRLDTRRISRVGIPDRFVEHGDRGELLADIQLSPAGIAQACRDLATESPVQL